MHNIIGWSMIVLLLFSVGCSSDTNGYVGNKKSHVFHRYSCEWGQRISAKNIVNISSRAVAVNKYHMRPCKVCKP